MKAVIVRDNGINKSEYNYECLYGEDPKATRGAMNWLIPLDDKGIIEAFEEFHGKDYDIILVNPEERLEKYNEIFPIYWKNCTIN